LQQKAGELKKICPQETFPAAVPPFKPRKVGAHLAYPRTATLVLLLGMCLGAPACAGEGRASFFNFSGQSLRLLPESSGQSQPSCRVQVTCHELPTQKTIKVVLDGRAEAPTWVDLPPDTLMYMEFLPIPGHPLAGTLGFQVVAEADDPGSARMVGTMAFSLEAEGKGALELRVTVEAPFVVKSPGDRPWHVVVRRVDPGHDAVAEAIEAEARMPKPKTGCIVM
jgi:hypothetical protein